MNYCLIILDERRQKVFEANGLECRSAAVWCVRQQLQLQPNMIGIVAKTDMQGNWLSATTYRNAFGKIAQIEENK